jgi:hypothetical protein
METNELFRRLEIQEKKVKRRTFIFTLIPILTAIVLITVTSREVIRVNAALATIQKEFQETAAINAALRAQNDSLKSKNDSLSHVLIESTTTLGKATSVLWDFKQMIDNMPSADRSSAEAMFFIEFRMLEERVRGNYLHLSEKVEALPSITEDQDWIVIVASSVSLEDLKGIVTKVASLYDRDQLAIYKEGKNYFRLAVTGNGTFTRAYRLNVKLIREQGFEGAYFDGRKDWGKNYLPELIGDG